MAAFFACCPAATSIPCTIDAADGWAAGQPLPADGGGAACPASRCSSSGEWLAATFDRKTRPVQTPASAPAPGAGPGQRNGPDSHSPDRDRPAAGPRPAVIQSRWRQPPSQLDAYSDSPSRPPPDPDPAAAQPPAAAWASFRARTPSAIPEHRPPDAGRLTRSVTPARHRPGGPEYTHSAHPPPAFPPGQRRPS